MGSDDHGGRIAHVKPGKYVVVPDDADLIQYATPVTVQFKQFADVAVVIPGMP
jgi:hypothetical protein